MPILFCSICSLLKSQVESEVILIFISLFLFLSFYKWKPQPYLFKSFQRLIHVYLYDNLLNAIE